MILNDECGGGAGVECAEREKRYEKLKLWIALGGAMIAAGGFGLTCYQIYRTNQVLKAGNSYQIQKDARDILAPLLSDERFRSTVRIGGLEATDSRFLDSLWIMFGFYLAVYRQAEANGLPKSFVDSFASDFCFFIKHPGASQGWDTLMGTQRIGAAHERMRKVWCTDR